MYTHLLLFNSGLFVQPKYAKLLRTSQVREMLGEPPSSNEPLTPGSVAPVPASSPDGGIVIGDSKSS